LSVGTHTITASATDSGGLSGSDQISITVSGNTAPSVSITAPADGATYVEGESITFTGSASDAEDGDLSADLAWTSDLDGSIGSGGSFASSSLSVGTHTITASVTDSGGLSGSDQITITVNVNTAPTVTITAPADGATYAEGESITFTGSASDAEDGDLTASLAWTSDLDGSIGSGGSFSSSSLSVGTHTITASATDSGGLSGEDQISITVIANTPPGAATLISPEGVIGDNTTPTYTWFEVETSTWYRLWVDGSSGTVINQWYQATDANCVSGVCAITPETVLTEGEYTWWIQTWNNAGYGPWSRGLDFWAGDLSPPGAATLISPSGTTSDTTPTYTWDRVDTATWYWLWVEDSLGALINRWYRTEDICAGDICAVTPNTTLGEGPHVWWVQTWNIAGFGPWSAPLNFYVGTPAGPGPTTLLSPSGPIDDTTPTYTWEVVSTATWYRLVVEGPMGTVINDWYKASNICDRDTGLCEVTPDSVLGEGDHSWWVKTWNPYGSTWSGRLDFSVSSGAAAASSTPTVSGDAYRLYLPLVVKPVGSSETLPPGPPIDDGDEGPPIEMLMPDHGPPDVGEESGPPIEKLGPGSKPPTGADEEGGPPGDSR
jgi:hypothetical protein